MKYYICLFLLILISNLIETAELENSKIVAVVEIIRHGARTPMTYLENSAKLYFGSRKAQLTINGLRQQILSGRWLRRRYVLGKEPMLFNKNHSKFNPQEVEVISSPLQRTIFSSTGHINGLFPNAIIRLKFHDRKQIKTNDIPPIKNFKIDPRDGKEVTINVISKEKDYVFHADKCKSPTSKKKNIFNEMKKTKLFNISQKEREFAINDIMKNYEKILEDKIKKVEKKDKIMGQKIKKRIQKVKETTHKVHLKKLISWLRPFKYHTNLNKSLNKNTLKTMKQQILNRWYRPRLIDTPALKYTSSYIFKAIHTLFSNKVANKKEKRKMIIFTGHDTNLVNALTNLLNPVYMRKRILKADTNQADYEFCVPPLASNILFELHKKKGKNDHFIKIIYNGLEINSNFIKPIKLNNKQLDYNDFMALIKSRLIKGTTKLICGKGDLK